MPALPTCRGLDAGGTDAPLRPNVGCGQDDAWSRGRTCGADLRIRPGDGSGDESEVRVPVAAREASVLFLALAT